MKREATMLLNVVVALVFMGVLMVYSAGAAAVWATGDVYCHFGSLLFHLTIGIFCMAAAAMFDYHHLRDRALLLVSVSITLFFLCLVLLFGEEVDGAKRWLNILGLRFQPSELAKLAVLVLLSVKLAENQEHIRSFFRGFVPPLIVTAVFLALVLAERDLGTPVVIACAAMTLLIVGGANWVHVAMAAVPGAVGVAFLCITSPHRLERLLTFLNPWKDRYGAGFQLIQSFAAFARGSLLGQGSGAGQQKLGYLPAAHNDFIFAVIGEELGLGGTLVVVIMFVCLLAIGFRIAECAPDMLGYFLAAGATTLLTLQAAWNMAVATGMVPTKGLPLPFISAGGTSLILSFMLVGLILSVALHSPEPKRDVAFAPGKPWHRAWF